MKNPIPFAKLGRLRQHRFFNDGWIVGLLILNFGINAFTVIWSLTHIHQSDILVPVRYTSLANFDILGRWYQLYYVVVASVIILMVNTILGVASYKRSRMISIFLLLVAAMVAALAAAIILGFTAVNYGTS